ncbi:hypothetical protein E4U53_003246, partial [Claviceps sorghi]
RLPTHSRPRPRRPPNRQQCPTMTMTNGTFPHPCPPPCPTSPRNTRARLTSLFSARISSPDAPPAQATPSTSPLPFPTIPPSPSRSSISSWQSPRATNCNSNHKQAVISPPSKVAASRSRSTCGTRATAPRESSRSSCAGAPRTRWAAPSRRMRWGRFQSSASH